MANGKVITGFSSPWVAAYSASGTTVTYSDGMPLARGVDVEISIDTGDDNVFYADNVAAERIGGTFTEGTLSLTVDGLLEAAEAFILGLPDQSEVTVGSSTVKFYDYGTAANPPYVGFGCVVRYMSAGTTTYVPVVVTKVRFSQPSTSAATQEDSISWQTQALEATIMQDDTAAKNWKRVGEGQTTEAAAVAAIQAILTPAT